MNWNHSVIALLVLAVAGCAGSDRSGSGSPGASAGAAQASSTALAKPMGFVDWSAPIDEAMVAVRYELTSVTASDSISVGGSDCVAGTYTENWPEPEAVVDAAGELPCSVISAWRLAETVPDNWADTTAEIVSTSDDGQVTQLVDPNGKPLEVTIGTDAMQRLTFVAVPGKELHFRDYDPDATGGAGALVSYDDMAERADAAFTDSTFHAVTVIDDTGTVLDADCQTTAFSADDSDGAPEEIIIGSEGWSRSSTEGAQGDGYKWSPIGDVTDYEYLPHACDFHSWFNLLVGYRADALENYADLEFREFDNPGGGSLVVVRGANGSLSLALSSTGQLSDVASEVDDRYYRGFFTGYGQASPAPSPSPMSGLLPAPD